MISDTSEFAREIRAEALRMVMRARASHIGGALSMADILAVLYGDVLRVNPEEPDWPERDRFILSKGHSTTGLYAALALRGFFPMEELLNYGKDGTRLLSHVSHKVPGVDFSTGSLGHGLPFGTGKALAAKKTSRNWRTFVLLSDGELDEGSNWEAFLLAAHHRLNNLVAIIDYNKIQSLGTVDDVIRLEPLADKFNAFGWDTVEVDGHDLKALSRALAPPSQNRDKPLVVIAHTIKGKGVSFMENRLLWHYRNPNEDDLELALKELGCDL